ncbi:hypothetical protein WA026_008417 [Henosepilachna vigintioctopunctata]|uniref:Uncharacterized protein n=1 Tax=Henosepilachna vigintioctopunctata TaxID=420089 RepID=A0AAW1UKI4_9CUCU
MSIDANYQSWKEIDLSDFSSYNIYVHPNVLFLVQDDDTVNVTSFVDIDDFEAYTTSSASATTHQEQQCPWKCELIKEAGYVVYSALGSFYLPMFVMLFFYWRIYKAAVRTTRAINQGFRTTKGEKINMGLLQISNIGTIVSTEDESSQEDDVEVENMKKKVRQRKSLLQVENEPTTKEMFKQLLG